MRLKDKVAIITGAASGIGRATARLFDREGARRVLGDMDEHGLRVVATEIGEAVSRCVVGDIVLEETARRLADEAVAAFGHVDILVNNAGIHFIRDITEMTVEQWDHLMDVNLKS